MGKLPDDFILIAFIEGLLFFEINLPNSIMADNNLNTQTIFQSIYLQGFVRSNFTFVHDTVIVLDYKTWPASPLTLTALLTQSLTCVINFN